MKNSFMTRDEIDKIGFKFVGKDVLISRKTSFYSPENISIGDHSRIDDFSIISGKVSIGSYVHISAYVGLFGSNGIVISDFCCVSIKTTILSATDDFSGESMFGSVVPMEYRNVQKGPVILRKYVLIGANCLIMPDLIIEEGVSLGAMSFVNKSLKEWAVYTGIPAKFLKNRKKNVKNMARLFLKRRNPNC